MELLTRSELDEAYQDGYDFDGENHEKAHHIALEAVQKAVVKRVAQDAREWVRRYRAEGGEPPEPHVLVRFANALDGIDPMTPLEAV